jgi:hypothetical protein
MVAASNDPYTVSIENITEFDDVHQRAQVKHGNCVYDIDWDNANERVIASYNNGQDQETQWFEIRHDDKTSQDITLLDALSAFGCVSDDTMPVLFWPLDYGLTIENFLAMAVSEHFLMQMDILPLEDSNGDDDPTPTSSENESIGDDDSDDPNHQE